MIMFDFLYNMRWKQSKVQWSEVEVAFAYSLHFGRIAGNASDRIYIFII